MKSPVKLPESFALLKDLVKKSRAVAWKAHGFRKRNYDEKYKLLSIYIGNPSIAL